MMSPAAIAVLMPHAPVLVPEVAGNRAPEITETVRAMREAARRFVADAPDAVVVVSPHASRRRAAFGISSADRLAGSLPQFGARETAVAFPGEGALAKAISVAAAAAGIETWFIPQDVMDATVVALAGTAPAGRS